MLNIDFTTTILIPIIVGLATFYIQKYFDLASISLFSKYRRRRAKKCYDELNLFMVVAAEDSLLSAVIMRVFLFILLAVISTSSITSGIIYQLELAKNPSASNLIGGYWICFIMTLIGTIAIIMQLNYMARICSAFDLPSKYVESLSRTIKKLDPGTYDGHLDTIRKLASGVEMHRLNKLKNCMYLQFVDEKSNILKNSDSNLTPQESSEA